MGAFSVHPSSALVKFWQGIVETALRVLCIVSLIVERLYPSETDSKHTVMTLSSKALLKLTDSVFACCTVTEWSLTLALWVL